MSGQATVEFTIIIIFFILMFIAVMTSLMTIKTQWISEKKNAELKFLCNTLADVIVERSTMGHYNKVYIPSKTLIEYKEGYLICKRDDNVAVSPIPGGFKPLKEGYLMGWVEI